MPKAPKETLESVDLRLLAALVERLERLADMVEGKPPPRRNDLRVIEGGKDA